MDSTKKNDFSDIKVGEQIVVIQDGVIAIVPITKINPKTFNAGRFQFDLHGIQRGGNEWHKAYAYRGEAEIADARAKLIERNDMRLLRDFDFLSLSKENRDKVLAIIKEHQKTQEVKL